VRPSLSASRCHEAQAAYPELEGGEQPPARKRASPLLGLAPGGGCLAASIAAGAGGLLHHLFTLTPERVRGGRFLWPDPQVSPPGCYPAPCSGERGLSSGVAGRLSARPRTRSPGRPISQIHHTRPAGRRQSVTPPRCGHTNERCHPSQDGSGPAASSQPTWRQTCPSPPFLGQVGRRMAPDAPPGFPDWSRLSPGRDLAAIPRPGNPHADAH
jgi:hypothetical protein